MNTRKMVRISFSMLVLFALLAGIATVVSLSHAAQAVTPTGLSINSVTVGEADGSASFEVTLASSSDLTVTVDYATQDGTATAGSDYYSTSGTLTFNPGTTTQYIYVAIINDTIDENDENFNVNLSNSTNADIDYGTGVGTIIDNDSPPMVYVDGGTASEADSYVDFSVGLDSPSGLEVTISYSTASDTATENVDYTSTSGTLTLSAGETGPKTISVPILDDSIYEGDETFSLNLTPSNAEFHDSPVTGTITDDELQPTLSIDDVTVNENAGNADFTVSLSSESAFNVSVYYSTEDGTAIAGSDYTATSDTLTINSGETFGTISVPIFDDMLVEGDETFTVILSGPDGATISDDTGVGTITDNETLASVRVAVLEVANGSGNNGYLDWQDRDFAALEVTCAWDTIPVAGLDAGLNNYDVLFIPYDQNYAWLTTEAADTIKTWVSTGGHLVIHYPEGGGFDPLLATFGTGYDYNVDWQSSDGSVNWVDSNNVLLLKPHTLGTTELTNWGSEFNNAFSGYSGNAWNWAARDNADQYLIGYSYYGNGNIIVSGLAPEFYTLNGSSPEIQTAAQKLVANEIRLGGFNSAPTFTSEASATFYAGTSPSFIIKAEGYPKPSFSITLGSPPAGISLTDNGNGTAILSGTNVAEGNSTFTITASNGEAPDATQSFTLTITNVINVGVLDLGNSSAWDDGDFANLTPGTYTWNVVGHNYMSPGLLGNYNILILPWDYQYDWTAEHPEATDIIKSWVNNGGHLIMHIPGGFGTSVTDPLMADLGPDYNLDWLFNYGSTVNWVDGANLLVSNPNTLGTSDLSNWTPTFNDSITIETAGSAWNWAATGLVNDAPRYILGYAYYGNGAIIVSGSGEEAQDPIAHPESKKLIANEIMLGQINAAPTFSSSSSTIFKPGVAGSFTIKANGYPKSAFSITSGSPPSGVSLADNGNGTATLSGSCSTEGSYTFTIKATNGTTPDATQSFTLKVSPEIAPAFTSADNTAFIAGTSGTFTVEVTGVPTPEISFINGTLPSGLDFVDNGDGTATISGTPDAGTGDPHYLTFTATNIVGSVPQSFALTVFEAPAVTTQPKNQAVIEGRSATFSAAARGYPPPDVKWQISTDNGGSWNDIEGATSTDYSIPSTTADMNGYQYKAVFTNNFGDADHTDTSAVASLTVYTPQAPNITSHPQHTAAVVGETAQFSVTCTGTPEPTYQWQVNTGRRWTDISGATGITYQTPIVTSRMNGYRYQVVISNSIGNVTSNEATLTVFKGPYTVADLSITKSGQYTSGPNPTITWTITVTNNGPALAEGVVVKDSLATGTKFSSFDAMGSGATAKVGGSTVTVTVGTLGQAGGTYPASVTFKIIVQVGSRATSPVNNTATVTTIDYDPDLSNNTFNPTPVPFP